MQVKDIGEFGLIQRLNCLISQRGAGNEAVRACPLLVDTGDDTAAWQTAEGRELFTTDTMVDDIHFTRDTTPWRQLGWKAVAANISDVASMGGQPTYALITLGLPPDSLVSDIEEMYRGMMDIGDDYGMAIVGGDIVGSPVMFVTTALIGVAQRPPMLRSNARPGDLVAVSGYVGSSGGGLRLMLNCPTASGEAAEFLRTAHRQPVPSVRQGRELSEAGIVTAMDISDGLSDDLSKLCTASGVSARINAPAIPVHPLLRGQFPDDYLDLALGGGEDYVLLFTGAPDIVEPLIARLGDGSGVIGIIEPIEDSSEAGRVTLVNDDGNEILVSGRGWDHLRRAETEQVEAFRAAIEQ